VPHNGYETPITPNLLEVIHVASHQKQQDLLTLLHDIAEVTAVGSTAGTDHYVAFECPDRRLMAAIRKLFAEVDPASEPSYISPQSLQPGGGGAA
jgi:hypothetical protein